MKYTIVLERDADGGSCCARPGQTSVRSQGDDREETLTNIREAIELYAEDCIAAGDPTALANQP